MVSPIFKPIRQEKVSQKIANQIKALIREGKLRPSDVLPPERELVGLFNVSRPSLREALNSLVGMGFLERTQANRTIVKSLASGIIHEPIDYLIRDDINAAFELIEVRKAIETWNAYYAAKRATPADIARLEENIESMKKKMGEGGSTIENDDADFHFAISEATHNKIQTHIMFTIYDLVKRTIEKHYEKIDDNDIFDQHTKIVQAIKEKDSRLARVRILEHLNYVESRIREAVESNKGSGEKKEDPPETTTVFELIENDQISI
jgi:GntR family transcriptional repressor for pyruvate dehydrogenase complex